MYEIIANKLSNSYLGAVHKRRPHKIAKNQPPLSRCPQNVCSGTPHLRTHHKFQKMRRFYKRRPHKIAKNQLFLPRCPQNVCSGTPHLRTHHKFQKMRRFNTKKCRRPHLEEPPLTAHV